MVNDIRNKAFNVKHKLSLNQSKNKSNKRTNADNFVKVCANITRNMVKNTVTVSVNQKKTNALSDSGASLSCISKPFLEKTFLDNKSSINPCHIRSIVEVGGTHHAVIGVVNIEVKFGTSGLCYPFYIIEDLHHTLILGYDFMEAHNVTFKGKKMVLQDNIKVCHLHTNTGYARTIKPITFPANSEVDIQVKIARINSCLFVWCLTTHQPLWVISVRRY